MCHPHCQYLKLASNAAHTVLNIQVPTNKKLVIDIYNKGNSIDIAVLESTSPIDNGEYCISNTKRDRSAIYSESLVVGQFVVEGLTCVGFETSKAKTNGVLECTTVTIEALDIDIDTDTDTESTPSTNTNTTVPTVPITVFESSTTNTINNRNMHVYISNPSTSFIASSKHVVYAYRIE